MSKGIIPECCLTPGDVTGFSANERPHTNTIFVGRIPLQTTEEELKANFSGCKEVRIIKDKTTGLSKG